MTILNIETSGKICSVAVSKDGVVEFTVDDSEGMKHAEKLAPFVEQALDEIKRKGWTLDAVAVSLGPGSYTGLRIGLSLAKGVAFSMGIPLIGVNTLQLIAVKGMFRNFNFTGSEILVPMIDARRMEVFTAAYNFALDDVLAPQALILDEESYKGVLDNNEVWFMGDGAEKFKSVVNHPNAHFMDFVFPMAKDMVALSEKAYREGRFLDVAYSVPEYLKEYQTTVPRKKV